MATLFRLVGLVALLIPVWILVLVGVEEFNRKDKSGVGIHAALHQSLESEQEIGTVAGLDSMEPAPAPDHWFVAGVAAVSSAVDTGEQAAFVATFRTQCPHYSDSACWSLEGLDLPVSKTGASFYQSEESSSWTETQHLMAVQTELRALGFDPGPLDGALGPRTLKALEQFAADHKFAGAEGDAVDLVTFVVIKGHLERGDRLFAKRDFHPAMLEYQRVLRLDPENAQARYRRGLMYRTMGASDLAIKEYDLVLSREADNISVLFDRGHAHYEAGKYWAALADYADSLGLRVLGERYLDLRERTVTMGGQAAESVKAAWNWAKATWTGKSGVSVGQPSGSEQKKAAAPT